MLSERFTATDFSKSFASILHIGLVDFVTVLLMVCYLLFSFTEAWKLQLLSQLSRHVNLTLFRLDIHANMVL